MPEDPATSSPHIVQLQASDVQLALHQDGSIDFRQPWGHGSKMKVLIHPDNAQQALWAALALRRAADHLLAAYPGLGE